MIDYQPRTWRRAARHGAGVGMRMTCLYAVAFLLYAIVRASIELLGLPTPDAGKAGTILATIVSLIVASAAIALVVLPISAIAGMAMSLLLHLLAPGMGRRLSLAGTFLTSLVAAFVIADTVQLIILPAAGFSPLALPFETWIFWFGLPTLFYIVTTGLEARRLRSRTRAAERPLGGGQLGEAPLERAPLERAPR